MRDTVEKTIAEDDISIGRMTMMKWVSEEAMRNAGNISQCWTGRKASNQPHDTNVSSYIPRYKESKKNLLGREPYQEALKVG